MVAGSTVDVTQCIDGLRSVTVPQPLITEIRATNAARSYRMPRPLQPDWDQPSLAAMSFRAALESMLRNLAIPAVTDGPWVVEEFYHFTVRPSRRADFLLTVEDVVLEDAGVAEVLALLRSWLERRDAFEQPCHYRITLCDGSLQLRRLTPQR